ncbi:MAG: hypothetical protein BAJALOKI1v1_2240002 [Promethearchaeota archaeon]|nr:MAG: hypothetical protein BAJALOKI1v1_2240002 [Candidatus Lokiarchaeota archaeon]
MPNSLNLGLTHYQAILLFLLSKQETKKPIFFQDIQTHLTISKHYLSQILSKLQENNLIERQDTRPQPIKITTLGTQVITDDCITPINSYLDPKLKQKLVAIHTKKDQPAINQPAIKKKNKEVTKSEPESKLKPNPNPNSTPEPDPPPATKKTPLQSKLLKALPKMIEKVCSHIQQDISSELQEIEHYINKTAFTDLTTTIDNIIEFYHAELIKTIQKHQS